MRPPRGAPRTVIIIIIPIDDFLLLIFPHVVTMDYEWPAVDAAAGYPGSARVLAVALGAVHRCMHTLNNNYIT